ncbi:MAG: ABC transporter permease [Sphingobacteriaceae bacterium]|nr:ABC transporter permease [Cytophagaceae bacterium]
MKPQPPRWATKLLNWWGHPDTREEVQGDLLELYAHWVQTLGERRANRRYGLSALKLLRPLAKSIRVSEYSQPFFLSPSMFRNYLKIAWRNLERNRVYSAINLVGLSVGMAVAMLIGLWMRDEVTFNRYHQHYDRLARVIRHVTREGEINTTFSQPLPLSPELRSLYGGDFERVVMASWTADHILAHGETKIARKGNFAESGLPELLTLTMRRGTRDGLRDPASILLSESVAKVLFGEANPLNQVLKLDNKTALKVTGVYEDLPKNTGFAETSFLLPWTLYLTTESWMKESQTNWDSNFLQVFVQLKPQADFGQVSAKIRDVKRRNYPEDAGRTQLLLYPMSRWHLYSDWENGQNVGGRIQFVWLFGLIGVFVLLLACINFMNLSTARSEKRAREVGIRKAVGSLRAQLVGQFFSESLLVTFMAFGIALLLVASSLLFFNQLADKDLSVPWAHPGFWLLSLGICLLTGLVAGSYPALYLSGFQPVKVLKGTFRVGRWATLPRQVLVVVQFTVSVTLIIGTLVVLRQVQHAKNRPVGYDRAGLITLPINTPELKGRYNALRAELLQTGAVVNMAQSNNATTEISSMNSGFDWAGKDPNFQTMFGTIAVTHDYGKTVGWRFKQGRDFSRAFVTDSSAMVMNEAAVKYTGLKNPVGQRVRWRDSEHLVIGVIEDMVMESPYEPARPVVFYMKYEWAQLITIRLNPVQPASESLERVAGVFAKFNPGSPFEYQFVDQEYARKFASEERIGQLAGVFAVLAIFISCLGLFGLASFVAEQRTKEIGIRKVLGATVFNLWQLLSKDFVVLVLIALGIATPLAWYCLHNWLQNYAYHTEISGWVFVVSGAGALAITLLTVSFQSIRAALMNPVKSLRSE